MWSPEHKNNEKNIIPLSQSPKLSSKQYVLDSISDYDPDFSFVSDYIDNFQPTSHTPALIPDEIKEIPDIPKFNLFPPNRKLVSSTLKDFYPENIYRQPYYSKLKDVPKTDLNNDKSPDFPFNNLKECEMMGGIRGIEYWKRLKWVQGGRTAFPNKLYWTSENLPPTRDQVNNSLQTQKPEIIFSQSIIF